MPTKQANRWRLELDAHVVDGGETWVKEHKPHNCRCKTVIGANTAVVHKAALQHRVTMRLKIRDEREFSSTAHLSRAEDAPCSA